MGPDTPLWLLDICLKPNWSASLGWGYVVKEIIKHHQTCLTHPGLTDGCCSRTFPLWRITSHITTGSGSSCSPGSGRCFPRTPLKTMSCSLGSRLLLKGSFFYCTFAVMLKLCFKGMCKWLKTKMLFKYVVFFLTCNFCVARARKTLSAL